MRELGKMTKKTAKVKQKLILFMDYIFMIHCGFKINLKV